MSDFKQNREKESLKKKNKESQFYVKPFSSKRKPKTNGENFKSACEGSFGTVLRECWTGNEAI